MRMPFVVRVAHRSDLPRLVELNHAAYPELLADGIVFDAAQIAAHFAMWSEGQIVVEEDGELLGAIATLIVPSARALAPHTWVEATSFGTFACHDPNGDALYLADVYSHPRARGRGVGAALYDAMFALCRRKRLAHVVAGGRLWGYHEVADRMSPEAYAAEVASGLRSDRVLTAQLRAGFELRGILPGYLEDWRSRANASHLVWTNESVRDVASRAPSLIARADHARRRDASEPT